MRKEKSRSPPKLSNGRFLLILACLPTTCKNTDSQGCVSIDFTLYYLGDCWYFPNRQNKKSQLKNLSLSKTGSLSPANSRVPKDCAISGTTYFKYEQKVKLVNPKLYGRGYAIGDMGHTDYVLVADDIVAVEEK